MTNRKFKARHWGLLSALGCTFALAPAFAKEKLKSYNPTQVRQVQCKLHQAGYSNTGPVDGLYGPLTTNAVAEFQTAHNLVSSGALDQPTYSKLMSHRGTDRGIASDQAPTHLKEQGGTVHKGGVYEPVQ